MKRATASDLDPVFDLVIIGGGINGAACAWEATLRGLSTLLVERGDFGAATSANSARIAHSGVRYLQHADFARLRESVRERCTLSRIAPHLVISQPFLMPIHGHGLKGRETMTLYMKLYDALSPERRRFSDPHRVIPDSRVLPATAASELWRELDRSGLSGLAMWYEGQLHDSERLLLSFLRSASDQGLKLANYMEATELIRTGQAAGGVRLRDHLLERDLEVRSRFVLNATGPWLAESLARWSPGARVDGVHASKAMALVVRPLSDTHALSFSIPPMYEDRKAVVNTGASMQFAVPWRGFTLLGCLHQSCDDDPARVGISEEEIERYLDLINQGYPPAKLRRSDIEHILWGIIPAEDHGSAAPLKHYRILDHERRDGIPRFASLLGVKLTTARDVAQQTIAFVARRLGVRLAPTSSATVPLWGGDIESLDALRQRALRDTPEPVSREVTERLVRTYGSRCSEILSYASRTPGGLDRIADTDVLAGEIPYAIHEEMAYRLCDVVLRRTSLGSPRRPSLPAIEACATLMARELAWDDAQRKAQIQTLLDRYTHLPIRT